MNVLLVARGASAATVSRSHPQCPAPHASELQGGCTVHESNSVAPEVARGWLRRPE
jgi:hypothetical protein